MASLENTEANEEYSGGSVGLDLDFSVAAASLVAVVSLAMIGDPAGMKQEPPDDLVDCAISLSTGNMYIHSQSPSCCMQRGVGQ